MPGSERLRDYLGDFGCNSELVEGLVESSSGKDIWVGTDAVIDFNLLKTYRRGMRAFRIFRKGYKPTTNFVQFAGKGATRNIELDRRQAERFIRGEDLEIYADFGPGYIIVSYRDYPLGVGKYRNGRLKNQIPRGRRVTVKI